MVRLRLPAMRTPSRRATALFQATLTASPGCSFFRSATQPVTIMATDPNAEIYPAGRPVGRGTATVELPRDQDTTILGRTDDNRAGTATVKSHMGSAGIFDIIGGAFILFPFFGLLAPGSRDLDASSVVIEIPPAAIQPSATAPPGRH